MLFTLSQPRYSLGPCLQSNSRVCVCPCSFASAKAVSPFSSSWLTSAPSAISNSTASPWPPRAVRDQRFDLFHIAFLGSHVQRRCSRCGPLPAPNGKEPERQKQAQSSYRLHKQMPLARWYSNSKGLSMKSCSHIGLHRRTEARPRLSKPFMRGRIERTYVRKDTKTTLGSPSLYR